MTPLERIQRHARVVCACSLLSLAAALGAAGQPGTDARKSAAILLFDGVQIIDFAGPFEILGYGFQVVTVSPEPGPITTNMGMEVVPTYHIGNSPPVDLLVLPGGHRFEGLLRDPRMLAWIREQAEHAETVMSVCNGAFFLAHAGLLDGLTATTTAGFIDSLQATVPSARVVRDQRFVDAGKVITTGGVSSGIDGALHVVGRTFGAAWAPVFARWAEYDWEPDSPYLAAMLADNNTRNIFRFLWQAYPSELLAYDGDEDRWAAEAVLTTDRTASALMAEVEEVLRTQEGWAQLLAPAPNESRWAFTGKDGRPWQGTVQITPDDSAQHRWRVAVAIQRQGVP